MRANAVGGWFSLKRLGKGVGSGRGGLKADIAGLALAETGVAAAAVLAVLVSGTAVDVTLLEMGVPALAEVATEMMGIKLSLIMVGECTLEVLCTGDSE